MLGQIRDAFSWKRRETGAPENRTTIFGNFKTLFELQREREERQRIARESQAKAREAQLAKLAEMKPSSASPTGAGNGSTSTPGTTAGAGGAGGAGAGAGSGAGGPGSRAGSAAASPVTGTSKPLDAIPQRPPSTDATRKSDWYMSDFQRRQLGQQSSAQSGADTPIKTTNRVIQTANSLRPSYTPSYGSSLQRDGSREPTKPFGYNPPSTLLTRSAGEPGPPGSASSSGGTNNQATGSSLTPSGTNAHQHSHASGPHHHHHHHHHVHSRSPSASTTPMPSASSQPAANPAANPNAQRSQQPPYRGTGLMNAPLSGGIRSAPSVTSADEILRERQRRMQEQLDDEKNIERARREREEREAKARQGSTGSQATSPRAGTANTSANPYPRPSLPPSPTNSRNLGAPASASPASSTKPSPSLPAASAPGATNSGQRPNLPLPSLSSIGGRSLPSPFDSQRDRASSTATTTQGQVPVHRRTPSNSSTHGADVAAIMAHVDSSRLPPRPPGTRPIPSNAELAAASASARPANTSTSMLNRYPSTAPTSQHEQPASASANKPGATPAGGAGSTAASSASSTNPQRRSGYMGGGYPFGSSFTPFGSGFDGYNSFGGWTSQRPGSEAERERQARAQREKEAEDRRRALAAEQNARNAKEKEEIMRREEEARMAELKKRERERDAELLKVKQQREAMTVNTKAAASYDPYRNATTAATDTALQQVAPRREPRPYEYKTENRDYQYTPRDKRPRMDAAVDDARRGNANKSRRRKEDDRPKSPAKPKDYSHLTEPTRKWPEVHSTAVESWLKTIGDLGRLVTKETYSGVKYRMSQHRTRNTEGAIVQVRIGGGFLGQRWKLRGEVGWDEASSTPIWTDEEVGKGDGEVCAGWQDRGVWGTDVYTDDSDLGLVLVHAGWIKWGGPVTADTDSVIVDVRVVPTLARYYATERNGVRTRGWGNGHDGSSIVIEAVRRAPVDKTVLSGRKNRKRRMAEMALQRELVFGTDCTFREPEEDIESIQFGVEERKPLAESKRWVNGVYASHDPVEPVFISQKDGPSYRYTPTALDDYLVRDEEEQGPINSLWTKDLELDSLNDRYRLSLLPSEVDAPTLRLVHTPLRSKSSTQDANDRTTVFDDHPSAGLLWTPQGLAFFDPGSQNSTAKLCRVSGFRWVPRENEWKVDQVVEVKVVDRASASAMEVDP